MVLRCAERKQNPQNLTGFLNNPALQKYSHLAHPSKVSPNFPPSVT
jgi:hypothetical protein